MLWPRAMPYQWIRSIPSRRCWRTLAWRFRMMPATLNCTCNLQNGASKKLRHCSTRVGQREYLQPWNDLRPTSHKQLIYCLPWRSTTLFRVMNLLTRFIERSLNRLASGRAWRPAGHNKSSQLFGEQLMSPKRQLPPLKSSFRLTRRELYPKEPRR